MFPSRLVKLISVNFPKVSFILGIKNKIIESSNPMIPLKSKAGLISYKNYMSSKPENPQPTITRL